MNLLASLPTAIGTAAVAPALLILWLVIAAGERPGPPAKVWTAFFLGAASISLLGVARAPFASILAAGLDGQPVDAILAVPDDFYAELGLAKLISPLRLRGMSAMLARIKRRLREA